MTDQPVTVTLDNGFTTQDLRHLLIKEMLLLKSGETSVEHARTLAALSQQVYNTVLAEIKITNQLKFEEKIIAAELVRHDN